MEIYGQHEILEKIKTCISILNKLKRTFKCAHTHACLVIPAPGHTCPCVSATSRCPEVMQSTHARLVIPAPSCTFLYLSQISITSVPSAFLCLSHISITSVPSAQSPVGTLTASFDFAPSLTHLHYASDLHLHCTPSLRTFNVQLH